MKTEYVMVPVEQMKKIHRDLDACQKVIWLGMRDADHAYCRDAQARLKEIDALLAAAPKPSAEPVRDGKVWSIVRDAMQMGGHFAGISWKGGREEHSAELDAQSAHYAEKITALYAGQPPAPEQESEG